MLKKNPITELTSVYKAMLKFQLETRYQITRIALYTGRSPNCVTTYLRIIEMFGGFNKNMVDFFIKSNLTITHAKILCTCVPRNEQRSWIEACKLLRPSIVALGARTRDVYRNSKILKCRDL